MSTEQHDSEIVALLTEHQLAIRLYVQSLLPGDHSAHDVAQLANATCGRNAMTSKWVPISRPGPFPSPATKYSITAKNKPAKTVA